jgi:hypothetical protein
MALLALALVCALLAFAVHAFLFASIVLLSILLGLMASNLRLSRAQGGVIAEVVAEAKSFRDDLSTATADAGDAEHGES